MVVADSIADSPAPAAPERILEPEDARAYRRFLEWSIGHGFKMAIVEVTAPRDRAALIAWTEAAVPRACLVDLGQASDRPLFPLLEQACPAPAEASVLLLTGLDDVPDRIKLCARLNIQRDELARDFPLPWVLLVHPATALDLVQHAPDFSDFASLWLREEKDEASKFQGVEHLSMEAPSPQVLSLAAADGQASPDLLKQAEAAIELSRYDEATDLLARYDLRHPEGRAKDAWRIRLEGLLLWRRGRPAEALSCFEEALRHCADIREQTVILGDIARIGLSKGEVDEALALFQQALQVFKKLGDQRSRALMSGDIARIRQSKGEVDEALALFQEALQVYEALGDRRLRAAALVDIARVRLSKGEVDEALAFFQQALQIFESLGDLHAHAATLGDIAHIRLQKGEVDEALALLQEAQQACEELGDLSSRAVVLGDIARIRQRKGEVDEALSLYQAVMQISEKLGEVEGIANAHWSIGALDLERGHFQSALEHLTKSYEIFRRIGRLDGICVVGQTLGQLLLMQGETAEGIAILKRSREGFEKLGRHRTAQQVQALLDSPLAKPAASAEG